MVTSKIRSEGPSYTSTRVGNMMPILFRKGHKVMDENKITLMKLAQGIPRLYAIQSSSDARISILSMLPFLTVPMKK